MVYALSKRVIESGSYQYRSMLNKLDVFLLADRITSDEYQELKGLMDEQQNAE